MELRFLKVEQPHDRFAGSLMFWRSTPDPDFTRKMELGDIDGI